MKTFKFLLYIGLTGFLSVSPSVGQLVISEFMASNAGTLADEDGEYPDWIEIHNPGTNTVNLLDWSLTDRPSELKRWRFPATNINAGAFMIVFASEKDRRLPGAPLHTSFKLSGSGEYLALVEPDGETIATEFAPAYPPQFTGVSYGFGIEQTNFTLLPAGAAVRALVPANDSLGDTWTQVGFDDSTWIQGPDGVGFDTGEPNPGEDSVASIIQASSPIAYWRLNETSGSAAANIGANGVAGTYQSVTLNVAGPRPPAYGGFENDNNAGQFNGTSSYVNTSSSFLSNLGAFSMAGWIRPLATPAARTGLFGQNDAVEFGFSATDNLQIWTPNGGSVNLPWSLPINQWYHVCAVADGSTLKLYTNGVLAATGGTASSNYGSSSSTFHIGGGGVFDASGNFFNGQIDEVAVWNRALSAAEISEQYQAASTPVASGSYTSLIGTDLTTAMHGVNSSAYLRYPFNLDDPSQVDRLILQIKYDDGFAAYLNGNLVAWRNAPTAVTLNPLPWNAAATTYHPDAQAVQSETINITGASGSLLVGPNVLAIQGLNTSAANSDFLISAELSGASLGEYGAQARYFTTPTPGDVNGLGTADLGPIISAANFTPAPPAQPNFNDPIVVTAKVAPSFNPITEVTLNWRVMFGVTNTITMFDDGQHGDGMGGDGIYGATIPANSATNGQMIRWFITAKDFGNRQSRWPLFEDPNNTAEYLGTVITDPSLTSKLPIFQIFVAAEYLSGIDTESGGRVALFYDGELYDNVYMELRGNTTAAYPKKSHRLNFNAQHPFRHPGPGGRILHTSLLAEHADPAYLRQYLSFWMMDLMGVPTAFDYPVRVQLNGAFYQLAFHNDVVGKEQVERLGYSPIGALYKAAGTITPDYYSTGGFEKKTRQWEGREDYDALAAGIAETRTLDQRRTFLFDNLNVPEIVNYLSVARFTLEGDDVWANMSVYRDTTGNGEWSIIPFDLNVSWGQLYCGDAPTVFNVIVATNDAYKAHPLYGGSQVTATYRPDVWNRIYDIIVAVPETREMLLRRERTLMDQFLQPPGTPFPDRFIEQHIVALTNQIWTEAFLDRQKWAWPCSSGSCGMYCFGPNQWLTNGINDLIDQFIEPRRTHFFVTHCETNTAKPIGLGVNYNAGIPVQQPVDATILVQDLDYNPASGNQAEEYICLTNPNPYAVDISNWKLDGAVRFTFQPGTIMPFYSVLYVSPDVNAFRARSTGPMGGQGLFVQGSYKGQLSARGETISVIDDTGRVVDAHPYPGNPSPAQQYLRITEIMYNPPPLAGNTNDSQSFEFIKLKNTGSAALDLTSVRFTNGIYFDFSGSAVTTLAPGEVVLVVRDSAAFTARYGSGFNIAGQYDGALDNAGERIQLIDASGEEILDFSYNNSWYPITDGLGFSLTVVDEQAEPDLWGNKSNWRASGQLYGEPGATVPTYPTIAPIVINEALTHSVMPPPTDSIELYNPTTTDVNIGGWFLTDDYFAPQKYRIPNDTVIAAGGYLVFDESHFNPLPGVPPSFALGADGDEVYLFSGDAQTNLTGYVHGFQFGAAPDKVSFGRYHHQPGRRGVRGATRLDPERDQRRTAGGAGGCQ